jgi:hypothetical protein
MLDWLILVSVRFALARKEDILGLWVTEAGFMLVEFENCNR